ncbi:MAG: hypothetical protein U5R48_00405 [Gammaproteobacteria bacterium]|nr:hypothetical protein [Gammaproteobacteria bacterium]
MPSTARVAPKLLTSSRASISAIELSPPAIGPSWPAARAGAIGLRRSAREALIHSSALPLIDAASTVSTAGTEGRPSCPGNLERSIMRALIDRWAEWPSG